MTLPALFDCFPQTAIIWWVVFIISGRDSNSEEAKPDRDPREHPGHLPPEPDKPGAAADPSLWQKLLSHLLQTFWRQRGRSVGAECLVWKTQVLVPGQSRCFTQWEIYVQSRLPFLNRDVTALFTTMSNKYRVSQLSKLCKVFKPQNHFKHPVLFSQHWVSTRPFRFPSTLLRPFQFKID